MAEYRQSAHAVFDLKYHMIWCTKYRKKVLRARIAERARDLILQICAKCEVVIVRGSVSPDHIHLLLAAPPIMAPAKLAQYIKGRSSRHLQADFPELRKQYWGQHMRARGISQSVRRAREDLPHARYRGAHSEDSGQYRDSSLN